MPHPHRIAVCTLVLASTFALVARAQSTEHPTTLTLQDGAVLPRTATAIRTQLFGAVEVYGIALYVDPARRGPAQLRSPDVSKALRFVVLRKDDDVSRRVTIEWWRELVPTTATPQGTDRLRDAFSALRQGDVVVVEYVSGQGTSVRMNEQAVASKVGHDLMLTFLDHWLGQRPVSEEIKQQLLGSS
jgi:hypothetical protein